MKLLMALLLASTNAYANYEPCQIQNPEALVLSEIRGPLERVLNNNDVKWIGSSLSVVRGPDYTDRLSRGESYVTFVVTFRTEKGSEMVVTSDDIYHSSPGIAFHPNGLVNDVRDAEGILLSRLCSWPVQSFGAFYSRLIIVNKTTGVVTDLGRDLYFEGVTQSIR